jgi:hypothetical protein
MAVLQITDSVTPVKELGCQLTERRLICEHTFSVFILMNFSLVVVLLWRKRKKKKRKKKRKKKKKKKKKKKGKSYH